MEAQNEVRDLKVSKPQLLRLVSVVVECIQKQALGDTTINSLYPSYRVTIH